MTFDPSLSLDDLNKLGQGNLISHLSIKFTAIRPDSLVASMPVDHRTKQPYGILHGGASLALSETLGSAGSWLIIDKDSQDAVGLEINANHLRAVESGTITGEAHALHLGRRTHVWSIHIRQGERLICVSRHTVMVIEKGKDGLLESLSPK